MKITIDTKTDSREDMERAIRVLQEIIGNTPSVEESSETGYVNMFGDTSRMVSEKPAQDSPKKTEQEEEEKSPSQILTY